MLSQEIQFFIDIKDGIVEQIGRTYIFHPEIKFKGKGIKWFKENRRSEDTEFLLSKAEEEHNDRI